MFQNDFAEEIANIGSGYAAKALSDFSNKIIIHKKPKVLILRTQADYLKLFKVNSDIVASLINFSGTIKGDASLILPTTQAFDMINLISQNNKVQMQDKVEDYFQTYNEIANIVSGAYFTAVSELMNIKIKLDIPHSVFGPAIKVIRIIHNIIGKNLGTGICIHTNFNVEGENIHGYFALFVNPTEFNKLAEKMILKK
jgi:chemotaxis protein CheC